MATTYSTDLPGSGTSQSKTLAGVKGARVTAVYCDDHVGGSHDLIGQRLGNAVDKSSPLSAIAVATLP